MATITITGTVSKVRKWSGNNGPGWGATLKDDVQYGKTYDISGNGEPSFNDGDTITVTGEPNVRWTVYGAQVGGTAGGVEIGDDIPF
jgi:hypothetical protein